MGMFIRRAAEGQNVLSQAKSLMSSDRTPKNVRLGRSGGRKPGGKTSGRPVVSGRRQVVRSLPALIGLSHLVCFLAHYQHMHTRAHVLSKGSEG